MIAKKDFSTVINDMSKEDVDKYFDIVKKETDIVYTLIIDSFNKIMANGHTRKDILLSCMFFLIGELDELKINDSIAAIEILGDLSSKLILAIEMQKYIEDKNK